jgi:flavorubredoxin
MEALITRLLHINVKNHYVSIFGSYTWAGASVKKLKEFATNIGWEQVGEAVEEKHALKEEKYLACRHLGLVVANRLKSDRNFDV